MSTPCHATLFTAAGIALVFGVNRAPAKPPDLPVDPKVTCESLSVETYPGAIRLEIGVSSDDGLTSPVPLEVQLPDRPSDVEGNAAPLPVIDAICPCLLEAFRQCWEAVAPWQGGGNAGGTEPSPPGGVGCPYMKGKEAARGGTVIAEGEKLSVLDNLAKVEKAGCLFEQGEYYRRTGHAAAACFCFEQVRRLCPGSRYDEMAARQLRALQAAALSEERPVEGEEQEIPPAAERNDLGDLSGLRRLPLTPPCERPLEGSLELLPLPKPVDGEALPVPSPPEGSLLFWPADQVDPAVTAALHEVLAKTGDPEMPKLLVLNGEPPRRADPPDGAAVCDWVSGSSGPDWPSLLLLPEEAKDAEEEEEDGHEGGPLLPEVFAPQWNCLLQEVLDGVRAGSWTEIDPTHLDRVWLLGEKQVGGVSVRVITDEETVWQCVVVALAPGATGDLRAAQRAENDRVTCWIESLNADTGEDAEDDWAWDGNDEDDDGPYDGR